MIGHGKLARTLPPSLRDTTTRSSTLNGIWVIERIPRLCIGNIEFPHLTKLGLYFSGWQIIRNAPMLEELKLTLRIITAYPQVLDMIPPQLKSLELDLVCWCKDVDWSPILRYLNRIALRSQLKELVIRFSTGDEVASILDAIYRHGQLESLKIIFTKAWESGQMERFLDGLVKVCPRLLSLELGRKNAPSTHSLNILKRFACLNKLAISIYRTADIDSFWDAIRMFPQPMCIMMCSSSDAEEPRIKYLRLKRPDIKINASRSSGYHM